MPAARHGPGSSPLPQIDFVSPGVPLASFTFRHAALLRATPTVLRFACPLPQLVTAPALKPELVVVGQPFKELRSSKARRTARRRSDSPHSRHAGAKRRVVGRCACGQDRTAPPVRLPRGIPPDDRGGRGILCGQRNQPRERLSRTGVKGRSPDDPRHVPRQTR